MTSTNDHLLDFRSQAAAASEVLRRSLPSGMSPSEGGISCCFQRAPDHSGLRTPIKIVAVACAILGLGGLFAAAVMMLISFIQFRRFLSWDDNPVLWFSTVCCGCGALPAMFFPTYFERFIVNTYLRPRGADSGSDLNADGIHVAVENALTCQTMKVLAEDVGYIYVYPRANLVRIEGLSYEYVIQGKDLLNLAIRPSSKFVLLSYAIGDERLDLAIAPRSLRAERKRQLLGSNHNLYNQIADALKWSGDNQFQSE